MKRVATAPAKRQKAPRIPRPNRHRVVITLSDPVWELVKELEAATKADSPAHVVNTASIVGLADLLGLRRMAAALGVEGNFLPWAGAKK